MTFLSSIDWKKEHKKKRKRQRKAARRWGKKQRTGKRRKHKRPNYQAYMQSPAWRAFKYSYWMNHKKICAACSSTDRICLHHVHYGYLGREREQDLVPLCWDCHEEFHLEHGTKSVMIEETNEFIESKQFPVFQ